MTYNQLISALQTLLESHAMIKTVKEATPAEWLNRGGVPDFPICCFEVIEGSYNVGREQVYNIQFFFLDKSGGEQIEIEAEVISDQWQTAQDIISLIRGTRRAFTIDENITIRPVRQKYEDYLSGVEFTTNITTQSDFDGCDVPTI